MRNILEQELKDILDKNGKWLKDEDGDVQAGLSSANLMVFQFQQQWAYYTFDGALRIGCIFMPISEWELGNEEIGKKNGYSPIQISMYGEFIKMCVKHFKDTK